MADAEFSVGDRVEAQGGALGYVRFYGTGDFAAGVWVGIELDEAVGKNDGSVKGKKYFPCKPAHGLFLRPAAVKLVQSAASIAAAEAPAPVASPAPEASPSAAPASAPEAAEPVEVAAPASVDPPASAPRPVEQTPAKPAFVPSAISMTASPSTRMYSETEYQTLVSKMKFLENKRAEDREKLKEMERLQGEVASLTQAKTKLSTTVQELQQSLRDARKEFTDYKTEREESERLHADMAGNVEELTLDKEVAEARADELQQQVDELTERVEELTMDLELLKGEREESIVSAGGVSSAELEQQKEQNARLKDALIKLRDASNEEKADLTRRLKELEKIGKEYPDLVARCDRQKQELTDANELVENLREQLEDALGSQSLVEEMSEKVMRLEDRISEQMSTIEDLEALNAVGQELEESHIENEKQMQAALEYKDELIKEQNTNLEKAQDSIGEYEQTILKFRDLVKTLQGDIESMRENQESNANEALSSQSQAMETYRLELQSSNMRSQARSIALDLRRLDGEQANDHLNFIKLYLPESFMKTENDPIRFLLLIKRLQFKTSLFHTSLSQLFRTDASKKGSLVVTDSDLSHSLHLRSLSIKLSSFLLRIYTFIQHCDVSDYIKLGTNALNEFSVVEKRIDALIELVRSEEIGVATLPTDLERSIVAAETFYDGMVAGATKGKEEGVAAAEEVGMSHVPMLVDVSAEDAYVAIRALHNAVVVASRDKKEEEGGEEVDYSEISANIAALNKYNKATQVLAHKLQRRMEELMSDGKRISSSAILEPLRELNKQYSMAKAAVVDLAPKFTQVLEAPTSELLTALDSKIVPVMETFKSLSMEASRIVDLSFVDSNIVPHSVRNKRQKEKKVIFVVCYCVLLCLIVSYCVRRSAKRRPASRGRFSSPPRMARPRRQGARRTRSLRARQRQRRAARRVRPAGRRGVSCRRRPAGQGAERTRRLRGGRRRGRRPRRARRPDRGPDRKRLRSGQARRESARDRAARRDPAVGAHAAGADRDAGGQCDPRCDPPARAGVAALEQGGRDAAPATVVAAPRAGPAVAGHVRRGAGRFA